MAGLLAGGLNNVYADLPQLSVRSTGYMLAGKVSDGTVLAHVWVAYADSHCGYRVWSSLPDADAGRYALSGASVASDILRVRLQGKNWTHGDDESERKGVVLRSALPSAELDVVADGTQLVEADTWPLPLQVVVTGCW